MTTGSYRLLEFDKKFIPPQKIQVKFSTQLDGMVTSVEAAQEVNHMAKKGTSWPHHFRMLKMAN